jgi:sec-independent protein translocase protein TatA
MARSLGRSLRIFKTEIKGMGEDDKAREERDEAARTAPKALPAAEVVRRDAQPVDRPRPRPAPRA